MNSKRLEVLLKKYWSGKATLEEENELKKFHSLLGDQSKINSDYFKYIKQKSNENLLDDEFDDEVLDLITSSGDVKNQNTFTQKYWYIAASLAMIISVSIIFQDQLFNGEISSKNVQVDTFEDPELAFEETKKALLFISSKLNKGSEYAVEFSKFEQSQNQLKQ